MAERNTGGGAALSSVLAEAEERAALIGRLLLTARRYARAAAPGQRSSGRGGRGENFRQFRSYQAGEEATEIDWRRSARGAKLYSREKEQETAQTLCLIPDLSPSMLYRSPAALASKEERALLWLFLLAELAAKGGDRVAVPGLLRPRLDRAVGETLAAALLRDKRFDSAGGLGANFADFAAIPRFSHIVLISDFLDEAEKIDKILRLLAEKGASLSLIAIADPAEIDFPFSGNILFEEPETGEEFACGRAESLRAQYLAAYKSRQILLDNAAAKAQARLMRDRTDAAPETKLGQLAELLRHI